MWFFKALGMVTAALIVAFIVIWASPDLLQLLLGKG